jgi:hypothetical protein
MTTAKQLYRKMKSNADHPHCWACGREGLASDRPAGWGGPWYIERAHIVASPRMEDARLVALLCSICHRVKHGERLILNGQPWHLPPLTLANLLWLKLKFDPVNYDRAFLRRYSVKRLPIAIPPPMCYRAEYGGRHAA